MLSSSFVPPEFNRLLELAEALALADIGRAADTDVAQLLGIAVQETRGAVALRVVEADVLALNRVLVLDLRPNHGGPVLADLIDWYREAGVRRFFIQPSPAVDGDEMERWMRSGRVMHYNNWMRLFRGVELCPPGHHSLRIERIGPEKALVFAEIVTTAFGMPELVRPWLASAIGRSNWRHYLAFDGDTPVATAALHIAGETGWMGFASTVASHRGFGAQSALIARRIADARAEGCRWLSVETAEGLPERPVPSLRNLRRLGFQVAYTRPNYLWSVPPSPPAAA